MSLACTEYYIYLFSFSKELVIGTSLNAIAAPAVFSLSLSLQRPMSPHRPSRLRNEISPPSAGMMMR